jgi:hypothetical protein
MREKKSDNTCVARGPCTTYAYGSLTTDDTKAYACGAYIGDDGKYCTWTTGPNCETSKATCAAWNSLTTTVDNIAKCKARKDEAGKPCTYDLGAAACRELLACENAVYPGS